MLYASGLHSPRGKRFGYLLSWYGWFLPQIPQTLHICDSIDHELIRRPYIPKLSEEQYKAFLKDYYILLKDVLGVKVEQLLVDELCTYTLSQMDVLTRKYQNFSTNSEAWKFGHDFLLAAVEEVDRTVLESAA